jgi:hypothetical protein
VTHSPNWICCAITRIRLRANSVACRCHVAESHVKARSSWFTALKVRRAQARLLRTSCGYGEFGVLMMALRYPCHYLLATGVLAMTGPRKIVMCRIAEAMYGFSQTEAILKKLRCQKLIVETSSQTWSNTLGSWIKLGGRRAHWYLQVYYLGGDDEDWGCLHSWVMDVYPKQSSSSTRRQE